MAIGMAWTAVGGKILIVEATSSRGKGKLEVTGQLGDIMKESVRTALGWIKSNAYRLKLVPVFFSEKELNSDDKSIFEHIDLHIHFPAAAIPKDGPSAGVTITTALISLLTNKKVRSDLSMTGEVSLKGMVLPVGGIKEKCLAAYSSGIKTILLPFRNQKDIEEITPEIKQKINFKFMKRIEDVLEEAIVDGKSIWKDISYDI